MPSAVNGSDVAALAIRARAVSGRLLGIAGAPGAGKSTLAAELAAAVPGAVVVPMDGFHLTTARLRELGRIERRGAPDTFDVDGFVTLLGALRDGTRDVVAPAFDRAREEPVPAAITVSAWAPLVIVEGNYLLFDDGPWAAVRGLLDEVWFVEVADDRVRRDRLEARFESYGMAASDARERVSRGSDAANARTVEATRERADLVVMLDGQGD